MAEEHRFTVGSTETHDVQIRYRSSLAPTLVLVPSSGGTSLEILVDGRLALRERYRFWIPRRSEYAIDIGYNEPHHVVVERIRPTWAPKYRANKFTVFVDGVEMSSFTE
jgi:hypothetical protein